jgi:B-block binding subunit of TFIIIC
LSSRVFSPTKISIKPKSDLIDQAFDAISKSGENGIFQTELCKVFSLDSRDGSRLVGNLERQSLISREKILYKGRWTYRLFVKKSLASEFAKRPLEIASVEGAPCFSCNYQHLCSSEDDTSQYSPARCMWIEDWVLTSFNRAMSITQNSENT